MVSFIAAPTNHLWRPETKASLTHHVVEALWSKLPWHFLYRFLKGGEGLLWMNKQNKKVLVSVCIRDRRDPGAGVTSHPPLQPGGPWHTECKAWNRGVCWEAGSNRAGAERVYILCVTPVRTTRAVSHTDCSKYRVSGDSPPRRLNGQRSWNEFIAEVRGRRKRGGVFLRHATIHKSLHWIWDQLLHSNRTLRTVTEQCLSSGAWKWILRNGLKFVPDKNTVY